jgi:hypothetical protein
MSVQSILNQLDPVSTFTSYYLKTLLNIILSIKSTTPKRPLFFQFHDYNFVCISRFPMLAKYFKSVLLLDMINLLILTKERKLWTATSAYQIPCKNTKEVSVTFLSYILVLVSNRLLTMDLQILSRAVRMGFMAEQVTFRQTYTRVVISFQGSITPPTLHILTCYFTFDTHIQCKHWHLSTIHKCVWLYSTEWLNYGH